MLSTLSARKAKITLSDYPYRRDIENRLSLAQLSALEVNILQEIIHHSLHVSIEQLAEELDISLDHLIAILDKLSYMKLFKRQGSTLIVDKEMRKYFEFQIEKFDDNFQPNLDFLQSILNKVPIHVLPSWYAIPRTSDQIFSAIIEKYFLTPQIYRQYLQELQFDNPTLNAIIKDVHQSPQFKVMATELMTKYQLTRECFEEYLLLLEYHFVCCLSYTRINDSWQEIVTPFTEWLEYLQFEGQAKSIPIQDSIECDYYTPNDFNFIHDLITSLKTCQNKKILPQEIKHLRTRTPWQYHSVIQKLVQVQFVKQYANGQFIATEKGKEWLSKPLPEKVVNLAVDPLNQVSNISEFSHLWNVRNLHLIEKSLDRLAINQWIEWHSFFQGFTAPIGNKEAITLKKSKGKWKYDLPIYTSQEKQFIQAVMMERLAELGIIATGLYQGKPCFCLTSFGYQFIH